MYPGTDLDLEIARQIFKLVVSIDSDSQRRLIQDRFGKLVDIPPYSTHVETAYQIINWFSNRGYTCLMASKMVNSNLMWYSCFTDTPSAPTSEFEGLTLPHSICRAALAKIKEIDPD